MLISDTNEIVALLPILFESYENTLEELKYATRIDFEQKHACDIADYLGSRYRWHTHILALPEP